MTREEQFGYLSATTDIRDIVRSHMQPGKVDDRVYDLLNQIMNEIMDNYDKKIAK